MVNSLVARGGCRQTVLRPLPGLRSWPGTSKKPYPANWAGVPDGPCRGWEAGRVPQKKPYPANWAGVPDGPCRGREAGRVPQKNRTRQTGQASLTAPAGAGKLAGYLKNPYPANWAGVPDGPCRSWEAGRVPQKTRTRQTWLASLTAPAGAGKLAGYPKKNRTRQTWQASLTPRGLGKYQNAPLNVSEASESIKTRR